MERHRKQAVIISTIGVVMILFGVTYSFFNYTRTGVSNTIKVGRIYFNSEQTNTITLVDVFPIDKTTVNSSNDVGTATITIEGDTTYDDGVEYQLTVSNLTNTVGQKEIPIDVVVTASGVGDSEDDYFNERGGNSSIYKVLTDGTISNNKQLLVGYITKGSNGVNGTVTIKAYLDKEKIAISDTYYENVTATPTPAAPNDMYGTTDNWVNGRTVLTTTEWNNLHTNGVSFQVKVEANEGIWVEEPNALNTIKKNVITGTTINFANNSGANNGEGLYILTGTENNTNPIYYYRGAVSDNNVIFGGYCWLMVRTTDTGGIKMIYNGLPTITGSGNNVSYDCGTTRPFQDDVMSTTTLRSLNGYFYADDYEIISINGNVTTYRLKSKNNSITQVAIDTANDAEVSIPTIATNYPYTCKKTAANETCTKLYKVVSYASITNANVYVSTGISTIGISQFNSNYQSVSDIGYMSNAQYAYGGDSASSNSIYGKNVKWNETTSKYLVYEDDDTVASSNRGLDNNHHYTCGTETYGVGDTECTNVRYYVGNSYFITLTNGELVEDALYKMTGNGTDIVKQRNANYVLNQNDSTAKALIENWFRTSLTNEVDNTKTNYITYLEDTIFCNDRSFKTTGSNNNYEQNGWNPKGGNLTKSSIHFGTWNRFKNDYYSTENVPSIVCQNETDRFTVSLSNGNGKLSYPVGLLTADEIIMAGEGGNGANNTSYYLCTGDYYWSLSPHNTAVGNNFEFVVSSNGYLDYDFLSDTLGVRPVISLKPGIYFDEGGDGTPTNPYVVKYN